MKVTADVVATLEPGTLVWYAWDPEPSAACREWIEDLDRNGQINSYVVDETVTRESLLLAAHEHDRRAASAFYTERAEAVAHLVASRGWVDRGDREWTAQEVCEAAIAAAARPSTAPIPEVERVSQMGLFG